MSVGGQGPVHMELGPVIEGLGARALYREGCLYGEVKGNMGNGHMGKPCGQNDSHT